MNRNNLVLIAVAALSLVAGAVLYHLLQNRLDSTAGGAESAPPQLHSIPLTDLEQRESLLSDWRSELLVVNFWAPWCAPCRREIPALIEINREFAARGVRVLGIAFDNQAQVERFASDYQIDYPLFLGGNRTGMYNTVFGNSSGSLPFTALLDSSLQVVYRHNGELQADELREILKKYL